MAAVRETMDRTRRRAHDRTLTLRYGSGREFLGGILRCRSFRRTVVRIGKRVLFVNYLGMPGGVMAQLDQPKVTLRLR